MSGRAQRAFDDGLIYARKLDDLYFMRDTALKLDKKSEPIDEKDLELSLYHATIAYNELKQLEARYHHMSKADEVFKWFEELHSGLCYRFASQFPWGQWQGNHFNFIESCKKIPA